ncbi:hypothetical protein ACFL6C_14265, partial [Myxococcota bacterium]
SIWNRSIMLDHVHRRGNPGPWVNNNSLGGELASALPGGLAGTIPKSPAHGGTQQPEHDGEDLHLDCRCCQIELGAAQQPTLAAVAAGRRPLSLDRIP